MGEWDDLRDKFDKDRNDAKLNKERATQKQRLVEGKGPELWKELFNQALAAANETKLMFDDSNAQIGGQPAFSVIYNREGERRVVTAQFNRSAGVVVITGTIAKKAIPVENLMIAPDDDNNMRFLGERGEDYTAQELVKRILNFLLSDV